MDVTEHAVEAAAHPAEAATGTADRQRRWAFWRSPADQPRWARPGLLAIAALAAVLYAANIGRSQYNGYFSMAVRSMTESWTAFLFGAADPAASITIDKVPGFLWPQAISALLFGFHPWALMLPQVLEGVICVLVLYRVVRRWAGPAAGLLAAGVFTLTPITAVMFGHTLMEDPALTMCLILAADAWQRAADTARLRWLLLAGAWIGLGFQAKMLQAWAVLPAFAAGYLLVAPTTISRRVRQLAVAGVVTFAISASWVLLATLIPAGQRPYIDGSTNDSAVAMVVGYNGTNRFGLDVVPGALGTPAGRSAPTNLPAPVQQLLEQSRSAERTGWGKLFGPELATQIGWGYPLALLALVVGLRSRRLRGGYLMWGVWLVVTGLAFSAGTLAHASYLAALAAPLAALTGAGIVGLWRGYRDGSPTRWLLPAGVAAGAAWTGYLLTRYPAFLPWLLPLMLVLAVAGVAGLIVGSARPRLAALGLVTGVAALSVAPAAWSLSTLDSRYAGSVLDAYAGPTATAGLPGYQPDALTPEQTALLHYVQDHRDGARYLLATDSWRTASPFVLATGQPVLPMGGFSGAVPAPTLPRFQQLVGTGQVHYVLLSGGFDIFGLFGSGPGGPPTETATITDWVRHTCTRTPVGVVPGAPSAPAAPGVTQMGTGQLYRC